MEVLSTCCIKGCGDMQMWKASDCIPGDTAKWIPGDTATRTAWLRCSSDVPSRMPRKNSTLLRQNALPKGVDIDARSSVADVRDAVIREPTLKDVAALLGLQLHIHLGTCQLPRPRWRSRPWLSSLLHGLHVDPRPPRRAFAAQIKPQLC